MKKIRLLIFDWDGTLMDSVAKIANCFAAAAKDLNLDGLTHQAICDVVGLGLKEAFCQLYPESKEQTISQLVDRYRQHYQKLDNTQMGFYPGVDKGVKQLSDMGYDLAVATGKARRGLQLAFQSCNFASLFVTTRCADETNSKPHPQMLFEILNETQTAPAEALMIGDSTHDLQMASNAGVPSLAVSYGVQKELKLQLHSPLACLDSFHEVLHWLTHNTSPGASA